MSDLKFGNKPEFRSLGDHSFDVSDAIAYGVDEAIILKNIRFWLVKNAANGRHCHDGYCWTYNSANAFAALFPYWTSNKIQKLLKKMEDAGLIISGDYNERRYDRTKWYTLPEFEISPTEVSDDCIPPNGLFHSAKRLIGESKSEVSIQPNGCNHSAKRLDTFSQTAEPIPDINTDNKPDINTDTLAADADPVIDREKLFDRFWKQYPNRKGKAAAVKAWGKLKLTDKLVTEIFDGLTRYCASPDWLKDGGRFIPHPATWLNGARWEDEIVVAVAPKGRHSGFDQRDYGAGLTEREDGTYAF